MPDDGKIVELFASARRAEWAGDVEPARRLLQALKQAAVIRTREPDEHPIAVILERAKLLDARLDRAPAEVPEQLVVQTTNLRGVIWRTGERNFELRAYLLDPSWEESLYRRAHAVAGRYRPLLPAVKGTDTEDVKDKKEQLRLYPDTERVKPDVGRGASWAMDGDVYLREVTVGDFALVRVKMVWAQRELPETFLIIRRLLEEALQQLEE